MLEVAVLFVDPLMIYAAGMDFVALEPDGGCAFARRDPGQPLSVAVAQYVPECCAGALGARLQVWFSLGAAQLPRNPLADEVIGQLGYQHPAPQWRGPVAISMAAVGSGGDTPPIPDEVMATLVELTRAAAPVVGRV
ncbi:hypothetical protein [Nocardia sp. NPDC051570]|uniref:hypothetical protein n=1 Tax=Nocardia sp. NPDC051570 TaxID=3364324 RepID=UPI0037AC8B38